MKEFSFPESANIHPDTLSRQLGVNCTLGLTQAEGNSRIKIVGPNTTKSDRVFWWQVLFRQFTSPFIYLLLLACLVAIFLGEWFDVGMIALFVFINTLLGFYQEYRSEQTVYLLKRYVIGRARVLREGKIKVIDSDKIVPGDIVQVFTGDIIPADLKFFSVDNLEVNESLLTGESGNVSKSATPTLTIDNIAEANNIGFGGTHVTSGTGMGIVYATGINSYIGQITKVTAETKRTSSFEKGLGKFSSFILRIIFMTLVIVFLTNLILKSSSIGINELLIFSIALAVSVIPEALPVVTTFSMSRGALRLAANKVVVKRLSAIEDLGSIEILCSDKTGTITENLMAIDDTHGNNTSQLLTYAYLLHGIGESRTQENTFDTALRKKLDSMGFDENTFKDYQTVVEIPFDPAKRTNATVLRSKNELLYLIRGEPEVILHLCTKLTASRRKNSLRWFQSQGNEGKRVLAVAAYRQIYTPNIFNIKKVPFEYIGSISFTDPVKKSALPAIRKAKELGVTIKLLTGDSKEVSTYVAKQTGLIQNTNQVMTAQEFEVLSVEDQHVAVINCHVFARTSPLQKFTIIKLLQETNEVGFLGEGINDAPALKIANVGLVVDDASDISREAADILLLRKSLLVIMDGIKEGREVFTNTVKYIRATLASNFGNFYAVSLVSLIIDFLPMLPIQLLLVNLFSDFPMISIATDNTDEESLKRPRSYNIRDIAIITTILGLVSTFFDFVYFSFFVRSGMEILRTNWFIASILTELVFLFSIRTHKFFLRGSAPSIPLLLLTGLAAVSTIVIPYTFLGKQIFHFVPPSSDALIFILGIVFIYFIVTETVKLAYYRYVSPYISSDNSF